MSRNHFNELSPCEALIMKLIWEAPQDIPVQELIDQVCDEFIKNNCVSGKGSKEQVCVEKGRFHRIYRDGDFKYRKYGTGIGELRSGLFMGRTP